MHTHIRSLLSAGVVIMLAVCALTLSCDEENTTTVGATTETSVDTASFADVDVIDYEVGIGEDAGPFLTAGPPRPDIIDIKMADFSEHNYTYDPRYTFTVAGKVLPSGFSDTISVRIIVFSMRFDPDTLESVACIQWVQTDLGDYILPFVVRFSEPEGDEGYQEVQDGVWVRSHLPIVLDSKGMPVLDMSLVDFFGPCWIAASVGGCIASAVGCIAAGPGYVACLGLGCSGSIIGMEIGCALAQVLFF